MTTTTVTLSDSLGDGDYNKAIVKANIPSAEATDVDLPIYISYAAAHINKNNGATVRIDYNGLQTNKEYIAVEAQARIQYRLYLNSNKTSSAFTGYAIYPHVIYSK